VKPCNRIYVLYDNQGEFFLLLCSLPEENMISLSYNKLLHIPGQVPVIFETSLWQQNSLFSENKPGPGQNKFQDFFLPPGRPFQARPEHCYSLLIYNPSLPVQV